MANVTVLSDNTVSAVPRRLMGEWGLSFLVETEGIVVLFDTGQSGTVVLNNGDILGIRWKEIDGIVLSHGHYDHAGGLKWVLGRIQKRVEVIAHPDAWGNKYGHNPAADFSVYAGIPFPRNELEGLGAQFRHTTEPVWLSESMATSGEIPLVTDYECVEDVLYTREGEEFRPDPLLDEQALFLNTGEGVVVFSGCAHRGIVNALRRALDVTGEDRINAVLGGAQVFRMSTGDLERTIADFKKLGVKKVGLSHSTNMTAISRLAQEFGKGFFLNMAGTKLSF
ncbi:MBL fold metallo-hydrolase [Chloroflexota bacterium]